MTPHAATAPPAPELDSVFDMIVNGGPLMVPIALCSVVALAYTVERGLRLRQRALGGRRLGDRVLEAAVERGPAGALAVCREEERPLTRVLGAGLSRAGAPWLEVEKAVEDAGAREVRRLSANLRPLLVVAMLAPLLGLLGTVWGMIESFASIGFRGGLGKPELLAAGISQALVTTAAGLAVAIPTQAAAFWFRGRIERFVRRTEDVYAALSDRLHAGAPAGTGTAA